MDDGRVCLGPLPSDVTGMILGSLRRRDRMRILLLSKAFYRAFWMRWATKRDFLDAFIGIDDDSCAPDTHLLWQESVSRNEPLARAVRGCYLMQYWMAMRVTKNNLSMHLAMNSVFSKNRLCMPTVYQTLQVDVLDDMIGLGLDATEYVGGLCMLPVHISSEGWSTKEFDREVKCATNLRYPAYLREVLCALRTVKSFRFPDVQDAIVHSLLEFEKPHCAVEALIEYPEFDASTSSAVLAKLLAERFDDTPSELVLRLVRHPTFEAGDINSDVICILGSRKGGFKILREIFRDRIAVEKTKSVIPSREWADSFLSAITKSLPIDKSETELATEIMRALVRRIAYSFWAVNIPKVKRAMLRMAKHPAFSMWSLGGVFYELVAAERKNDRTISYDTYEWLCSNRLIPKRDAMQEIARYHLDKGALFNAEQLVRFLNGAWMYDFGEEGYDIMEMEGEKRCVPILEFLIILKEKCPTFCEADYLKHALSRGWLEDKSPVEIAKEILDETPPRRPSKRLRTHV